MKVRNSARISFLSRSSNESFARSVAGAFVSQLDPTLEQITDIKTAVSEAVTNCIVHGYPDRIGNIVMTMDIIEPDTIRISIADRGAGIEDVKLAMQPLFTTGNSDERVGLGFSVMETFMDKIRVTSKLGRGTRVTMKKRIESV